MQWYKIVGNVLVEYVYYISAYNYKYTSQWEKPFYIFSRNTYLLLFLLMLCVSDMQK